MKPIEPIKQMKQNTGPYREPNVYRLTPDA
jgi:hypothetical protein